MCSIESGCGVEIKIEESPPDVEGPRVAREAAAVVLLKRATKIEEERKFALNAILTVRDEARALSKSASKQFRRIEKEVQQCAATRRHLNKKRKTLSDELEELEKKRKTLAGELKETKKAQREKAKARTGLHLILMKKKEAMKKAKKGLKFESMLVFEARKQRNQAKEEVDRINAMVKR